MNIAFFLKLLSRHRRRSFDIFLFRGDSYCSVILIRRRRYPDIVYIAIFLTEKYI